jgi:microcystin-dependent protein
MSKRIEDLTAAETIELANTLLEIQQLNLTAGAQSRKLQLDDLRSIMFPAGFFGDFAGSSAPDGWLACDGSAVSRSTYADLFAAIGTTWGVGDGSTTFNVPDLRGAFVRGTGSHGSETMADGNAFAGPSVGAFENDSVQQHGHNSVARTPSESGASTFLAFSTNSTDTNVVGPARGVDEMAESFSPSGGTPRTGDETRPFAAGVLKCIKT